MTKASHACQAKKAYRNKLLYVTLTGDRERLEVTTKYPCRRAATEISAVTLTYPAAIHCSVPHPPHLEFSRWRTRLSLEDTIIAFKRLAVSFAALPLWGLG